MLFGMSLGLLTAVVWLVLIVVFFLREMERFEVSLNNDEVLLKPFAYPQASAPAIVSETGGVEFLEDARHQSS